MRRGRYGGERLEVRGERLEVKGKRLEAKGERYAAKPPSLYTLHFTPYTNYE
jgi:hypothetical protein